MKMMRMKLLAVMSACLCCAFSLTAQTQNDGNRQKEQKPRWTLADDGRAIVWQPEDDIPHYDHLEMTGEKVSEVLRWGVDADGAFRFERSLVFPTLRKIPNDTHGSLVWRTSADVVPAISIEDMTIAGEKVTQVRFDGILTVKSLWNVGWTYSGADRKAGNEPEIEMTRMFFPSADKLLVCEKYTLKNIGGSGRRSFF